MYNAESERRVMNEPKTPLGEQLRRLRLAKGYRTVRAFAKSLGISENRYGRYERGEAVPKPAMLSKICRGLGITPNELYAWQPGQEPSTPARGRALDLLGFGESDGHGGAGNVYTTEPSTGANTTGERAMWRFASALVEAGRHSSQDDMGAKQLDRLRAAAVIFLELKSSPLETMARALQAPELQALPPELDARLATEVQAFLASLDSGNNGKAAP